MHNFLRNVPKARLVVAVICLIVVAASTTGYALHWQAKKNNATRTAAQSDNGSGAPKTPAHAANKVNDAAPVSTPAPSKPSSTAPAKLPAPTPAPATPSSTPAPAPPVNTTNCLPPNPSVYATYYIHMTNAQYLNTNAYGETNELYDALQFAGLLDEVDTKQYVVFAPNDYAFNNLSAAQLAWMNQSPENMRSVLGWQIATSCITYDGVNPVKNATGLVTIQTLNGTVTYYPGSPGKIENTSVAIWDWFTSNGSVTFVGFIKPPQI